MSSNRWTLALCGPRTETKSRLSPVARSVIGEVAPSHADASGPDSPAWGMIQAASSSTIANQNVIWRTERLRNGG